MKNSRGQQLLDTFGALSGAHLIHTICHFESREVSNPTLQTVCFGAEMKKLQPLEANHTKLKANFAAAKSAFGCEMETFSLRNFTAHLACLQNPPKCFQIFSTDSFRFFSSDICCLNPHSLLVIHQS